MVTTVTSHCAAAISTRLKCPSCKAPIVATRPMVFPRSRSACTNAWIAAGSVTNSGWEICNLPTTPRRKIKVQCVWSLNRRFMKASLNHCEYCRHNFISRRLFFIPLRKCQRQKRARISKLCCAWLGRGRRSMRISQMPFPGHRRPTASIKYH